MNVPPYIDKLRALDACPPALVWLTEHNYPTFAEAWVNCPYGEWLLWALQETATPMDPKIAVRLACDCAELSVAHAELPPQHPITVALATARAWCEGTATVEVVAAARANIAALWGGQRTTQPVRFCWAHEALDATYYYATGKSTTAISHVAAAADHSIRVAGVGTADIVRRYFPAPPALLMTVEIPDETAALLRVLRLPDQTDAELLVTLVRNAATTQYYDLLTRDRERALPYAARQHLNALSAALGRPRHAL